ncbi:MAG TPA: hypothetical protein VIQ31_22320 [Phormidium sp.]
MYELKKVADDQSKSLYDINKAVYSLLRYGVKVREEVSDNTQTVWLIKKTQTTTKTKPKKCAFWKNELSNFHYGG